jgi:hypothetical protein
MNKRKIYSVCLLALLLAIASLILLKNKTIGEADTVVNNPIYDDKNTVNQTGKIPVIESSEQKTRNSVEPANMKDLFADVAMRYNNGTATISEVADVINVSNSNTNTEVRWQWFIDDHLKVKDFDAMMNLIASEINPDIAATLSQILTSKALRANSVDMSKLLDIIPEGRLRRYALVAFLKDATSDQIIKYAEYLKVNENIDKGNLWVRTIVGETGIDSCNADQLKILYGLFVGPGKYWVAQELAQQARKNSSSLTTLGEYMTANDYPKEIRSNILRSIVSKYDKNALLSFKPSKIQIDPDSSSLFLREVSKRIVDLTNYQTATDWIVNNDKSDQVHSVYDETMKDWLKFSSDSAAKKITTIEDPYYRNRGYFLLAEYLHRPEEKELRSQWINAITDEVMKAEAIKKFGNR